MEDKKEVRKITVDQAIKEGIKYFFYDSNDDQCYPLDEMERYEDGETIYAAIKGDYMNLDPEWIVEDFCQDLHEDAASNAMCGKDWEEFKAACEKFTKACRAETQCYYADKSIIIINE